jgi:hypothetical protein
LTRYQADHRATSTTNSPIRTFKSGDLPRIIELDRAATGVCRENLLTRLIADSVKTLIHESDGEITGYGVLRPGSLASYLGPIVTTNPTHAQQIASALADSKIFCDLPDQNNGAAAWAKSQNLTPQRTLTRMYLGENITAPAASNYFAIAAPELG